jgi:glycerol-3-phosphate acyltransferase PlsY
MKYLICVLIGYLIGSINPSYIISKLRGGDIREKGSGNAGASNALIVYGKLIGVFCALFDIGKAFFAVWLMQSAFSDLPLVFALTAVACILGHVFPFYMRFRGGKGLASLGGVVLAYNWLVFLIMLTGAIIIGLITNYICFIPITAAIVFPIIYGVLNKDVIGSLILYVASVVILLKHRQNIKRIRNGTEMHLSYLWNKEEEIARVQKNQENKS